MSDDPIMLNIENLTSVDFNLCTCNKKYATIIIDTPVRPIRS